MKNNSSRKLLFTTIAIVVLTLLAGFVINLLTGRDDVIKWQKDNNIETTYLLAAVIIIGLALILLTYFQIKYTENSEEKTLTENIEPDVKKLHDSLKERYQKRYESKLDERFEIKLEVSEDWDGHKTQTFKERYDKDAKISEAFPRLKELFDTKDGLLIVGEPGAGKTVLLLKVALNLLEKTNLKEKEPFPVIFNLASWNEDYKDFGEWLKAMLVSGNGLSKDFAERLLREKRFILLLDGLDELARNDEAEADKTRAACLESLNDYLDGEKTVICCRIDEFAAMQKNTAQDAPVSAKVEVLNLTEAELLNALEHAQNHADTKYHASAKIVSELIAKDENAALRKILCTPFYFTIALEVFYKRINTELNHPKDEDKLKTFLIEKYIDRKLDKTPNQANFNKQKVMKWFKWLAKLMEEYNIVTFELADLQPIDLRHKSLFDIIGSLSISLICLLMYRNFIVSSIVFIISYIYLNRVVLEVFKELSRNRIVRYDFFKFFRPLAIIYLILQFTVLIIWANKKDQRTGVEILELSLVAFIIAFLGWIVILSFRIRKYMKYDNFAYLSKHYQRISAQVWVNATLLFLLMTILFITSFSDIVFIHFYFLPLTIRILFITSIFWHFALRFCLWCEKAMPLKYATFLDYAAEARILEKDGGQWRFRHQNLQEYFADLMVNDK